MIDKDTASDGYIEKMVHVGRVSKTTKGGRKMSFVALIVVGDGKGKVGYGLGKAAEVPAAMKKASAEGRRNMRSIDLNGKTIWHEINQRFGATKVFDEARIYRYRCDCRSCDESRIYCYRY